MCILIWFVQIWLIDDFLFAGRKLKQNVEQKNPLVFLQNPEENPQTNLRRKIVLNLTLLLTLWWRIHQVPSKKSQPRLDTWHQRKLSDTWNQEGFTHLIVLFLYILEVTFWYHSITELNRANWNFLLLLTKHLQLYLLKCLAMT